MAMFNDRYKTRKCSISKPGMAIQPNDRVDRQNVKERLRMEDERDDVGNCERARSSRAEPKSIARNGGMETSS
ncbi:unnamed protein product [Heligmosomoides polygyrus]|uniref:Uncharacterized protein n=1 Tax=Heligmosomoides polygyrus TaxID=6339 RepID=A0A183G5Q6_HELPZ|nr:unnamed protein product [Heligmosomoides polygyrus]